MNLDEIIEKALQEDVGSGDITAQTVLNKDITGKARLKIKEKGILAGIPVAEKVFQKVDPSINITVFKHDGEPVVPGDIVLIVEGNIHSLLIAERLVLNFMQRLSGIATMTSQVVAELKGLKTRVLDTRKTTPNLRELEKYAVRLGGGENHRMGLYDMILVKDNHIDFAGGITPVMVALENYKRTHKNSQVRIEIEVRSFEELEDVILQGKGIVDRIMLDNFEVKNLANAVVRIDRQFETEASGGIKLSNIRNFAETGVDFISVGALTHKFQSLDMSLKVVSKTILSDDW
jgi:nicotinate-nucleotide pyrophosphorylase (carboxylating)